MQSFSIPRLCSFGIVIQSLSCGEAHAAMNTKDGYTYTMGSNDKGNLGIGQHTSSSNIPTLVQSLVEIRATSVSCGYNHTCIVTDQGQAFVWGDGENG